MIIKEKDVEIQITQPNEVAEIFESIFKTYDEIERSKEHLYTIGLDGHNHILFIDLTHIGTTESANVDRKVIMRILLLKGASGLILVHNHPSEYGTPTPSYDDYEFTEAIKEACKLLNIALFDHIILNTDVTSFYSFKHHSEI